jgi:hypothetical protein
MKNLGKNKNCQYTGNDYNRIELREIISAYSRGKSGLMKAFFCLLLNKKPKYIENGNEMPLEKVSDISNKKNVHHIFPKALMIRLGFKQEDYNTLANYCFLPFGINIDFQDEKPREYFESYRKKKRFKDVMISHILPYKSDSYLWTNDIKAGYKKFLKERVLMIAKEFNEQAGKKLFIMKE